nr:hypothetical protein [Clostridioides sp.]
MPNNSPFNFFRVRKNKVKVKNTFITKEKETGEIVECSFDINII